MKHRWHITGMLAAAAVVLLALVLVLGACDNGGAQEVKMITAGKPNVEISLAGNYGVKLTWDDVLNAASYEIWRSEGELPMEKLANIGADQKDKFGRYVYYDIVDYDKYTTTISGTGASREIQRYSVPGDAVETLKANTRYVYELVALPIVHSRDMVIERREITTGSISPNMLAAPTATITVNGEARTITWTVTLPSTYLPGIKTASAAYGYIRVPVIPSNRAEPTENSHWNTTNGYYGHTVDGNYQGTFIPIEDFSNGTWTRTISVDDLEGSGVIAAFTNDYGGLREGSFRVNGHYVLGNVDALIAGNKYEGITNAYFNRVNFTADTSFAPQFVQRENKLDVVFNGEVTLYNTAEVFEAEDYEDYEGELYISRVAAKADGIRVGRLEALIDISNVVGKDGVEYTIQRAAWDAGDGKVDGEWEDITASLMTIVSKGGHNEYVPAFGEDEPAVLTTDLVGFFEVVKFYDRTLPVKNAEYVYRLHTGAGAAADWVTSSNTAADAVAFATVSQSLDVVTLSIEAEMLQSIEQGEPNSIVYRVTPRISRLGVLNEGDRIELYYMRSEEASTGPSRFPQNQYIQFTKEEIESEIWKDVFKSWVTNPESEEYYVGSAADAANITKVEQAMSDIPGYGDYVKAATKEFRLAETDDVNQLAKVWIRAEVVRSGRPTADTRRQVMGLESTTNPNAGAPFGAGVVQPDFVYGETEYDPPNDLNEVLSATIDGKMVYIELQYRDLFN